MSSLPAGKTVESRGLKSIVVGMPFWTDYKPLGSSVEVAAYDQGGHAVAYGRLERTAGDLASLAAFNTPVEVGLEARYRVRPPSIPASFLDSKFPTSSDKQYGLLDSIRISPSVGMIGLGPWPRSDELRLASIEGWGGSSQAVVVIPNYLETEASHPRGFSYLEGEVSRSLRYTEEHPPLVREGSSVVAVNSEGEKLGTLAADDTRWDRERIARTTSKTSALTTFARRASRSLIRPFLKDGAQRRGTVAICAAQVCVTGLANPQLSDLVVVCDNRDWPLAAGYVSWLPEHPQHIKDLQAANRAGHIHRLFCRVVISRGLGSLSVGPELDSSCYRFYKRSSFLALGTKVNLKDAFV